MNGKEKITEMVEIFKKQKEEFTKKMKEEFNKFFKDFFIEHPYIKKVTWDQYNNYFNDGDECPFRMHFYDLLAQDRDDTEIVIPEGVNKSINDIEKDLKSILIQIPDEVYLDMFGNHVSVTATVDGFDVEECEHD